MQRVEGLLNLKATRAGTYVAGCLLLSPDQSECSMRNREADCALPEMSVPHFFPSQLGSQQPSEQKLLLFTLRSCWVTTARKVRFRSSKVTVVPSCRAHIVTRARRSTGNNVGETYERHFQLTTTTDSQRSWHGRCQGINIKRLFGDGLVTTRDSYSCRLTFTPWSLGYPAA
jgi:hypothetical protein